MDTPLDPELGELPPPEDRSDPMQFTTPLSTSDPAIRAQVVQRRTEHVSTGRLVDFAVILQRRSSSDEQWTDVVRVDTAHRYVHVHDSRLKAGKGDTAVVPSDCRYNIDRAYLWAIDYIWQHTGEGTL